MLKASDMVCGVQARRAMILYGMSKVFSGIVAAILFEIDRACKC